jgi:thiol-disulfide isomerase/thioredoxin
MAAIALLGALGCAARSESTEPLASGEGARPRLLEGGSKAFRRRLGELRGRPVVVNQWASWCTPCRKELPWFARLAKSHGNRVVFLGVNSLDGRADALAFLRRYPTPFPHYYDPDGEIARLFFGGRAFPTTAFYTADGKLATTKQGAYPSAGALEGAIRRYALRG